MTNTGSTAPDRNMISLVFIPVTPTNHLVYSKTMNGKVHCRYSVLKGLSAVLSNTFNVARNSLCRPIMDVVLVQCPADHLSVVVSLVPFPIPCHVWNCISYPSSNQSLEFGKKKLSYCDNCQHFWKFTALFPHTEWKYVNFLLESHIICLCLQILKTLPPN